MMPAPLLSIHDLFFTYPGQAPLAAGWSAAIGPGVTALQGDIGSGKSTLLRVLAGALPAAGRLALNGVPLEQASEAYRSQVFYVDPSTTQFDALGVRACSAALRVGDDRFDEAAWQALVEGFALAPHLDKAIHMLSTGSRRKVWLAAALASGRPLVLLDEPAAALDAASVRCLHGALARKAGAPAQALVVASAEALAAVPLAARFALPLR